MPRCTSPARDKCRANPLAEQSPAARAAVILGCCRSPILSSGGWTRHWAFASTPPCHRIGSRPFGRVRHWYEGASACKENRPSADSCAWLFASFPDGPAPSRTEAFESPARYATKRQKASPLRCRQSAECAAEEVEAATTPSPRE